MRIVLQRVSYGAVTVEEQIVGEIQGPGLVLLVGIGPQDDLEELRFWAEKCVNLRVFPDEAGKMNRSLLEVGGSVLAVSQFTLYGETRKGRRPGFSGAAPPEMAARLYDQFVACLRQTGVTVATGIFQAHMDVTIHNDGPVTLLLGSDC
ncbi:D-tyrosyl-tRNA(Tyr) deacylase [bacterium (Candidatus Blackallbacteria) CG17_big_fil_post_rev_8_21_14_2_50_48_46]|uniref:D-aminoacyl-tRNA deacylase n=1 Tax=bacterium (Candidatus Blackallbacteria) CG17_big_fil_post_rev_8_21_14_2_50_48_46 TaxID=2014261 RepID=A0A2M7G298_9BACT|nr:MAG: D-tyrosyl-tRNA(Tyr) deacylase [bacterium (Candidatus Blackallbacteria) CG18_big_fil_WC_8_21_14_2_50_49_26]PIW15923.1 MAG: D-tyrosyl-tRNA(Tyr) deacylase [bacterium (Candidatus Blackallbacteria) CG17_big_fil_post_rev_8_21_14_2_50_48_46]PIW50335.1 MAG: D-tyrosyl-tRNA(Tyr) deacylase [bacterium (Candidatus Blackallbacteria) CG13_big_fil_rev_8_21_14_2_50_49_14]